jgi:hypothetical protein
MNIQLTKLCKVLSLSLLAIGVLASQSSYAKNEIDLSKFTGDAQQKFKNLTTDLHAIISYEDSQPAISKSGIIPFGFEVGLNISQIGINSKDELKEVGFDASSVLLPRLYGELNVFSFGFAATYTPLYEGVNISGYKLKYNILDGSKFWPALSANINYSSMNGADTLKSNALAYNLGVAQDFLLFTVYANLGASHGSFDPKLETNSPITLKKVETSSLDGLIGVRLNIFGIANVGLQARQIAEHNLFTFNMGVGF